MTLFTTQFWDKHGEAALTSAIKIAVIVVGYLVLRFVLGRIIRSVLSSRVVKLSGGILQARKARIAALQSMLMSAVGFVLGFVAMIMILQAATIDPVPLLTTASVAGLAIGFGAQKLVRDVISGFFILAEDQYGVGDYVTIGAVTGVVEDLEMRTTRVRDAAGKLYILSNGDISQVCNHSRGKLMLYVDYAITPTSDRDKACAVMNEVGESMAVDFPKDVKEPFKCEGVAALTAASVVMRIAGAVSPVAQDKIKMQLNERLREAFAKNDIALA